MTLNDWPVSHASYGEVGRDFSGGAGFIRVLGPSWIYDPARRPPACPCGGAVQYVCQIASEGPRTGSGRPGGYLPGEWFTLHGFLLYFYLCAQCRLVLV